MNRNREFQKSRSVRVDEVRKRNRSQDRDRKSEKNRGMIGWIEEHNSKLGDEVTETKTEQNRKEALSRALGGNVNQSSVSCKYVTGPNQISICVIGNLWSLMS